MLRLPPFAYHAPRTATEAARILADLGPDAMVVGGGTDLYPNMKRRQFTPRALVGLRQDRGRRRHPRQRRPAAGRADDARRRRRRPHGDRPLAGGRAHRGPRGLAAAAQRRHHRRQPVRRHPLQLLQPDRILAGVHRLLHEARRRHLPGGSGLEHLLGAVVVRHRAGDDRAGRRRDAGVGPRRAADRGRRSLRHRRHQLSLQARGRDPHRDPRPGHRRAGARPIASCGAAARSISPWSGWRRRCAWARPGPSRRRASSSAPCTRRRSWPGTPTSSCAASASSPRSSRWRRASPTSRPSPSTTPTSSTPGASGWSASRSPAPCASWAGCRPVTCRPSPSALSR